MAITTRAQLETAIQSWADIGSADIGSTTMDDLVMIGEKRLLRDAQTKEMEASLSTAMPAGTAAVPADYFRLKYAYIDGTPVQRLERRPAEWIYQNYPTRTGDSKPLFIAREGSTFIFGPFPDSNYTLKGVYYKNLTAISGSATNALFDANQDLYLFACLAESEIIIGRDERIPMWEAKYQKILAQVNGLDDVEDQSGSTLQMRGDPAMVMRLR